MERRRITSRQHNVSDGDPGVKEKIRLVWQIIRQGWKDPTVRLQAEKIIRDLESRDREGEVREIFSWVKKHWHYVNERVEQFKTPRLMIGEIEKYGRAIGDCDDATILIGALVGSLGIRIRTVAIGTDDKFYHIFPEAFIDDQWVALDIVGRRAAFGERPTGFSRRLTAEGIGGMIDYRKEVASRVLTEEEPGMGLGAGISRRKRLQIMATGAAGALAVEHLAIPGIASLIESIKEAKAKKRKKEARRLERKLKKARPEIYEKRPGFPPPSVIQQAHGLRAAPAAPLFSMKNIAIGALLAKVAGLF